MSKDITKELLEKIKETLPETQVGLIKEALIERDNLLAENKSLRQEIDSLTKDIEHEINLKKQVSNNLTEANIKIEELESALKGLKLDNENFVKQDVERRAQIAEAKLDGVQETQQLFLKNTIVREKIQHQVIDESPATINEYNNGYNTQKVIGVNKYNRQVTDVKEAVSLPESDEE